MSRQEQVFKRRSRFDCEAVRRADEVRIKLNMADVLFGCWHRHLSFPFSVRPGEKRPVAACQTGTYVVCLKCGKEFPYDWDKMCMVPLGKARVSVHSELEIRDRRPKFLFQEAFHEVVAFIRTWRSLWFLHGRSH
jgi:hypothetical protein